MTIQQDESFGAETPDDSLVEICDECFQELRVGFWPFCPHERVEGPHPIVMERQRD
jgi:hypothetical protein